MVTFSVIIPTLNEAKHIERCLLSLHNQQTDESYEVIVADSHSTDGTVRIAEKYADKVVLCDKGISLGRNTGAKASKGRNLVFLDGDSVASRTLLAAYADAFSKKSVIAATGPIFPLEKLSEHEDMFVRIGSKLYTESWIKFLIKINKPAFIGSNSAFRRDAFFKCGGFREDLQTFEDGDLSMRLAGKGEFMFHENARVYTSIRRLKKWGYLKFIKFHTTNTLKYMLFKKAHENYGEVR
ncbi:MAG: glycosyltransferase [Candidatus Micrarchaeia archaeon]